MEAPTGSCLEMGAKFTSNIPDVQVGTVLLVTAKELFHSQSKTVFKESNLEESVVEALHNLSREL